MVGLALFVWLVAFVAVAMMVDSGEFRMGELMNLAHRRQDRLGEQAKHQEHQKAGAQQGRRLVGAPAHLLDNTAGIIAAARGRFTDETWMYQARPTVQPGTGVPRCSGIRTARHQRVACQGTASLR